MHLYLLDRLQAKLLIARRKKHGRTTESKDTRSLFAYAGVGACYESCLATNTVGVFCKHLLRSSRGSKMRGLLPR